MTVGEDLRTRRKKLGLTLEQAAGSFMSISRLSNIEHDKTIIDPKTWEYLKNRLKLPGDFLNKKSFTEEITQLEEQGYAYASSGLTNKAAGTFEKIIEYSRHNHMSSTEANAHYWLGKIYLETGQLTASQKSLDEAYRVYTELADTKNMVQVLLKLGVNMARQNKFSKAIGLFEKGLDIDSSTGDITGEYFYNLAACYHSLGEIDQTASFCEKALSALRANQTEQKIGTYILQGILFGRMTMLDTAAVKMNMAKSLAEEIGDVRLLAKCLHNLGFIAYKKKKYDQAHKYYQLAIEIKSSASDSRGKLRTEIALAKLDLSTGGKDLMTLKADVENLQARSRETSSPYDRWLCLNILQDIAQKDHDEDSYQQHAFKALQLANEMNNTQLQQETLEDLALHYFDTEDMDGYQETLHDLFSLKHPHLKEVKLVDGVT